MAIDHKAVVTKATALTVIDLDIKAIDHKETDQATKATALKVAVQGQAQATKVTAQVEIDHRVAAVVKIGAEKTLHHKQVVLARAK